MKKYEKVPDEICEISQKDLSSFLNESSKEDNEYDEEIDNIEEFIELFNNRQSNEIFVHNSQWDNWYKFTPRQSTIKEEIVDIEKEKKEIKKMFFKFPSYTSISIVDIDDLESDEVYIGLYENRIKNERIMFIWKNEEFEEDSDFENYLSALKKTFFDESLVNDIDVRYEIPLDESEEFLNLL